MNPIKRDFDRTPKKAARRCDAHFEVMKFLAGPAKSWADIIRTGLPRILEPATAETISYVEGRIEWVLDYLDQYMNTPQFQNRSYGREYVRGKWVIVPEEPTPLQKWRKELFAGERLRRAVIEDDLAPLQARLENQFKTVPTDGPDNGERDGLFVHTKPKSLAPSLDNDAKDLEYEETANQWMKKHGHKWGE